MSDMQSPPPDPQDGPLPPDLRFLKWLVTALAATMMIGLITIIALFVIRMPGGQALPAPPDGISLPEGEVPSAVTFGAGWIAVVTSDSILIYDAQSGALRQSVALTD